MARLSWRLLIFLIFDRITSLDFSQSPPLITFKKKFLFLCKGYTKVPEHFRWTFLFYYTDVEASLPIQYKQQCESAVWLLGDCSDLLILKLPVPSLYPDKVFLSNLNWIKDSASSYQIPAFTLLPWSPWCSSSNANDFKSINLSPSFLKGLSPSPLFPGGSTGGVCLLAYTLYVLRSVAVLTMDERPLMFKVAGLVGRPVSPLSANPSDDLNV